MDQSVVAVVFSPNTNATGYFMVTFLKFSLGAVLSMGKRLKIQQGIFYIIRIN